MCLLNDSILGVYTEIADAVAYASLTFMDAALALYLLNEVWTIVSLYLCVMCVCVCMCI